MPDLMDIRRREDLNANGNVNAFNFSFASKASASSSSAVFHNYRVGLSGRNGERRGFGATASSMSKKADPDPDGVNALSLLEGKYARLEDQK